MAESAEHLQLKAAAAFWASAEGYRAIGEEVRVPNSNFRADVAACKMERPAKGEVTISQTAVFECKQVRSDFLNDSLPEIASRKRLAALHQRRQKLEEMIGLHYPNLRQGDSLFPEYQRSDPRELSHKGYQKVIREIQLLERGIFGRTKFERMIRYRCADLCYLVVGRGIVEPHEVPLGWGILEVSEHSEEIAELSVIKKPGWNEAGEGHRLELLFNIAAKGRPLLW